MPKKADNISGLVFNGVTVINRSCTKGNSVYWLCKCHCGNEFETTHVRLKNSRTKSCGCLKSTLVSDARTKHGECKAPDYIKSKEGRKHYRTRIYKLWDSMKTRCYHGNNPNYKGKGIEVCDEWRNDFTAFYDWAINNGYRDGLSIDRVDCNGNYEPENCRWVDAEVQNNNRSTSVFYEYEGQTKTLVQWARHYNISYSTLLSRWRRGIRGESLFKGGGGHPLINYAPLTTRQSEYIKRTIVSWLNVTEGG